MSVFRQSLLLLILLCFSTAAAQDALCTATIQEALLAVDDACADTGRNQACYGNIELLATPREGVNQFVFEEQGDLVNVADVDTLRLQGLDTTTNTWGIALMRLQANIPDSLPGQNVTFLLFGDVEIQNAAPDVPDLVTMDVAANGGINVRSGPSTSFGIVGSLVGGETAIANGRNADASWLRIQLPGSDSLGWVFAELVTATDQTDRLLEVSADDAEVPFTPMQAFYLRTGIGQPACSEAPQDGILIQTPEGAGTITLRANDVDIQLGSTAYLQAEASAAMTVSVLEGQGTVSSEGVSVDVPAGAQVEVPLNDDLSASGPPSEPRPYDAETLAALPVDVLPEPIEIAPPVSADELDADVMPGGFPGGAMMPGLPGFEGMNSAVFCQIMGEALAEAGMTTESYLALLDQYRGMMPAEVQADLAQFEQMLSAC